MLSSFFTRLLLRSRRFREVKAGMKSGGLPLRFEVLEDRTLPAPLVWLNGVNLPAARAAADAIVLGGTNLWVLGGTVTGGGSTTVLNLNPSGTATSWTGDFGLPEDSRTSPGVGTLPDGHILIFGGSSGGATSSALDYDLGGGNPVS